MKQHIASIIFATILSVVLVQPAPLFASTFSFIDELPTITASAITSTSHSFLQGLIITSKPLASLGSFIQSLFGIDTQTPTINILPPPTIKQITETPGTITSPSQPSSQLITRIISGDTTALERRVSALEQSHQNITLTSSGLSRTEVMDLISGSLSHTSASVGTSITNVTNNITAITTNGTFTTPTLITPTTDTLTLTSTTPSDTTNLLYNTSGSLYWNGNLISGAATGVWSASSGNVYRETGNVGIGTTTPGSKLTVDGGISGTTLSISSSNTNPFSAPILLGGYTDIRVATNKNIYFTDAAGTASILVWNDSFGSIPFGIDASKILLNAVGGGNVGVGTTTPFSTLSVQGITTSPLLTVASSTGISLFGINTDNSIQLFPLGTATAVTTQYYSAPLRISASSYASSVANTFDYYVQSQPTGGSYNQLVFWGVNGITTNRSGYIFKQAATTGAQMMVFDNGSGVLLNLIDSSGYQVRLTPTSAGATFNTWQSANPMYTFSGSNGSSAGILVPNGSIGIGTTTPWAKLSVNNYSAGASTVPLFVIASSTGASATSTAFIVDSLGNVGIGTANPSVTLDVAGNITGYVLTGGGSTVSSYSKAGYFMPYTWSADLIFKASEIERMRITNPGLLGLGTTSPFAKLSIHANNGDITTTLFTIASSTVNATTSLFTVLNTGYVGIGTESPLAKLQISGSSATVRVNDGGAGNPGFEIYSGGVKNASLTANTSNGDTTLYSIGKLILTSGNVGIGTTTPWGKLSITNTGTDPSFVVEDSTSPDTTPFIVDANGYVGIGKSNPGMKLDIAGGGIRIDKGSQLMWVDGSDEIRVEDTPAWLAGISNVQTFRLFDNASSGAWVFQGTGTNSIFFSIRGDSGRVGIGTTTPWAKLSVNNYSAGVSTAPLFVVASSTGAGATSTAIFVSSTGNVGINTTNPTNTLDVTGNLRVTNTIYSLDQIDLNSTLGMWSNNYNSNSAGGVRWTNGNEFYGTYDLGLARNSAGVLRVTNGSTGMGNLLAYSIGIGTTSPSYLLHVGSSTVSGIVARFENSSGTCDINPTTTSLSCSSDIRLKKNITTITASSSLEKVLALNAVMFNWNRENDMDTKHPGFIAQEIELVLPELVTTNPDGLKSVSYTNFIPYLVQAIQQLQKQITEVKSMMAGVGNGISNTINTVFKHIDTETVGVTKGLEITDQNTGEVYCVTIAGGDWKKVKGTCDAPAGGGQGGGPTVPPIEPDPATTTPPIIPDPPTEQVNLDPAPVITVEADVTASVNQ